MLWEIHLKAAHETEERGGAQRQDLEVNSFKQIINPNHYILIENIISIWFWKKMLFWIV